MGYLERITQPGAEQVDFFASPDEAPPLDVSMPLPPIGIFRRGAPPLSLPPAPPSDLPADLGDAPPAVVPVLKQTSRFALTKPLPATTEPGLNPVTPNQSFAEASTDATGMPAANTPGLTRLGKLFQILGMAAKGGLAGQAAAEQAVAQSGGHRSAGFGTGFQAGVEAPYREAAMQRENQMDAIKNQVAQQQLQPVSTPWGPLPMYKAMQRLKMEQQAAELEKGKYLPTRGGGVFDVLTKKIVPGTEAPEKEQNTPAARKEFVAANPALFPDEKAQQQYILYGTREPNEAKDTKIGERVGPDNVKYATFMRPDKTTYEIKVGAERQPANTLSDQNAPTVETIDPESRSILAQTGLSLPAFMALTGNSSQLSRDAATRQRAFKEAQKWANKHGVDVSTMASQYKTYNEVLGKNISRLNNTRIMEQELEGTIDNLKGVVDEKDLGRLRFANVAKIWAGQEVNDDLAQQYAMHLYQLRNELAAYGAATQGRGGNEITLQDQREAEQTIRNGVAKGSLNGLEKAVKNSTEKMGKVMQRSVDTSRQAVWALFGVGERYKPTYATTPPSSPQANDLDKFWKK